MCERDKMIAGLQACGWRRDVTARTNKYQVFVKDGHFTYLVGSAGALRRIKPGQPIASSISSTDSSFAEILKIIGEHADAYKTPAEAVAMVKFLQRAAA
jgi:hypothetical protein